MTKKQELVLQSTAKFSVLAIINDGGKYMYEPVHTTNTAKTGIKASEGLKPTKEDVKEKNQTMPEMKSNNTTESKKKDDKKGKTTDAAPATTVVEWNDDLQSKYELLRSVGEECQTDAELKTLLATSTETGFRLYDGFEPSGRMHIAQGVFKAMNVNKCTRAGGTFVFWVADWFALMNDKMGGDLAKIQIVGEYLIEVWRAAGMDLSNDQVVFKWASQEITQQARAYWPQMLDIARRFNITRVKKCCQIMGRLEGGLTAAQVLYPLMQCTDVFFLNANICQLGVDQRKVNMLAREYAAFKDAKKRPPVILSHHMLYGLKAGQEKMSKSDPDSAVFMEDTEEDVRRKIMAAYCPSKPELSATSEKSTEEEDAGKSSMHLVKDDLKNPCLDYVKNIIFSPPDATFQSFTDSKKYNSFDQVKEAFLSGEMSEIELKEGIILALNKLLDPVRNHFTNDDRARELLESVRQFKKEAAPIISEFRRLDLPSINKNIPSNCHLVFAPLPSEAPTLQSAMDVIAQLRACPEGHTSVLFLSDWSARVRNACQGDDKVIQSYYDVFLCCLKALDPKGMETVVVVKQSEAILADPSNYWISVINIGRHFMLDDVMGTNMTDSDSVGKVIARLMTAGDALSLNPGSIAFLSGDEDSQKEMDLVSKYLSVQSVQEGCGRESASVCVNVPPIEPLYLQLRDSGAHQTENDEYYLLDDPKVHGKAKMKKAFCQPGNVEYCPVVSLVSAFTFSPIGSGSFTVSRSPENGGDITYNNRDDILKDFASETLHPGDLKTAATALAVSILDLLATRMKADSNATKGAKALKAFQKKNSKSKK